jgi:hypothetical protein
MVLNAGMGRAGPSVGLHTIRIEHLNDVATTRNEVGQYGWTTASESKAGSVPTTAHDPGKEHIEKKRCGEAALQNKTRRDGDPLVGSRAASLGAMVSDESAGPRR